MRKKKFESRLSHSLLKQYRRQTRDMHSIGLKIEYGTRRIAEKEKGNKF